MNARRGVPMACPSETGRRLLASFAVGILFAPLGATLRTVTTGPESPRVRLQIQTTEYRMEDLEQSADGSRLVTHNRLYAPRLWDARSGRILRTLGGLDGVVEEVTFSKNGSVVFCRADGRFALWDAKSGERIALVEAPRGSEFRKGAVSPDGQMVAVALSTGPVWLWRRTGNPTLLMGPGKPVADLAFDPNGTQVAAVGAESTGFIWRTQGGTPQRFVAPAPSQAWVRWDATGQFLTMTGTDGTATQFQVNGQRVLWTAPHVMGEKGDLPILNSAATPVSGGQVAVFDAAGRIELRDQVSGQVKATLPGTAAPIREVRVSRDGKHLATASTNNRIGMWDLDDLKGRPFVVPPDSLPTAGEFSPDGSVFWMGYVDGSVRPHAFESGVASEEFQGWLRAPLAAGLRGQRLVVETLDEVRILDPRQPLDSPRVLPKGSFQSHVSADGRRALTFRRGWQLIDVPGDRVMVNLGDGLRAGFSPDGEVAFVLNRLGTLTVLDAVTGEAIRRIDVTRGLGRLFSVAWLPKRGGMLLNLQLTINGERQNAIAVLDGTTFEAKDAYAVDFAADRMAVSPNGEWLIAAAKGSITRVRAKDGSDPKRLSVDPDHGNPLSVLFSADGARGVVGYDQEVIVVNPATGEADSRISVRFGPLSELCAPLHPDGRHYAVSQGDQIVVWDLVDKVPAYRIPTDGVAISATWMPDGKRLLVCDDSAGVHVVDAPSLSGAASLFSQIGRSGTFAPTRDQQWVFYDAEGRFDAPDAAAVRGAIFVLRWSGGLEPVEFDQLKDAFHDPGLMARVLGLERGTSRPVPQLDSLRMYPEVKLTRAGENIEVAISERENGGIGRVEVALNGKRISTRTGAGYFRIGLKDVRPFLLPSALLPPGRGNVLTVTVANRDGTLSSRPWPLDLGVPTDLQAPPVRLFALFVGVGDYAGTGGDLQAPARDAAALAKAIQDSAERLLPGRVNITVLATTPDAPADRRPTRANILRWFAETAPQTTPSDIVMVFMAGHGLSQIGERRDYFFLTPETDPNAVTPLTAETGAVSGTTLRDQLTAMPAAKQVVVLDTCQSGAALNTLGAERSAGADYQRAYEALRDSTGMWLLAGAAADQKSYESANVEHGLLTYSLLEAIDRASGDGLRAASSGELFLDVERWLTYAANRVESLRNEVGITGIQRPQLKRSRSGASFDLGVTRPEFRGKLGLRPPMPVVLLGTFDQDEEDPLALEAAMRSALRQATTIKPWLDVTTHPNAYRLSGRYEVDGVNIRVRGLIQRIDERGARRTLASFEATGRTDALPALAGRIRELAEARILQLESQKGGR